MVLAMYARVPVDVPKIEGDFAIVEHLVEHLVEWEPEE